MSRETKAGLIVSASFLLLVGVVLAKKLRDGEADRLAAEVTLADASEKSSEPERKNGTATTKEVQEQAKEADSSTLTALAAAPDLKPAGFIGGREFVAPLADSQQPELPPPPVPMRSEASPTTDESAPPAPTPAPAIRPKAPRDEFLPPIEEPSPTPPSSAPSNEPDPTPVPEPPAPQGRPFADVEQPAPTVATPETLSPSAPGGPQPETLTPPAPPAATPETIATEPGSLSSAPTRAPSSSEAAPVGEPDIPGPAAQPPGPPPAPVAEPTSPAPVEPGPPPAPAPQADANVPAATSKGEAPKAESGSIVPPPPTPTPVPDATAKDKSSLTEPVRAEPTFGVAPPAPAEPMPPAPPQPAPMPAAAAPSATSEPAASVTPPAPATLVAPRPERTRQQDTEFPKTRLLPLEPPPFPADKDPYRTVPDFSPPPLVNNRQNSRPDAGMPDSPVSSADALRKDDNPPPARESVDSPKNSKPEFSANVQPVVPVAPLPPPGPSNPAVTLQPPKPTSAGTGTLVAQGPRSPLGVPFRGQPTRQRSPRVDAYDELIYRCKPNDTFKSIALSYYRSDRYENALLMYNRNHPRSSIDLRENPPKLRPGQIVFIPDLRILEQRYASLIPGLKPLKAVAPPPIQGPNGSPVGWSTPSEYQQYRVAPNGEMIREIAGKTLGNRDRWTEIYKLNLRFNPKYPIPGGTILRLPADARVPPTNRP